MSMVMLNERARRRRPWRKVGIATVSSIIITTVGTFAGFHVIEGHFRLSDDILTSVYVGALLLLYLLNSNIMSRSRGR